jgi:hypothetical protein
MEFLKKPTKETTLSNNVSNNTVLSFGTGAGTSGMFLGGPRDETITDNSQK